MYQVKDKNGKSIFSEKFTTKKSAERAVKDAVVGAAHGKKLDTRIADIMMYQEAKIVKTATKPKQKK